jgi:HK97 family phage portal protein
MNLVQRMKGWFGSGAEGSDRGMPWGLGHLGGMFQFTAEQGFQRDFSLTDHRYSAPIYSCVMPYCRAISQCQPQHLVPDGNGGTLPSTTSPASRVLRYPNDYETWANFIYNVVAEMLFEGEALAVKVYDDRFAVVALHRIPRRSWTIHVDPETREVFYGLNQADMFSSPEMLVPQRDVVHFRQHTPRHPLVGESPIKAAALSAGIHAALTQSQLFFFNQMNRPSGILSTDLELKADQMKQLRTAFNEQSQVWAQGGVPILASGLKFQPVNIAQGDAQLVEQQRLSTVDVARVFGIPMTILSETSAAQAGTEAMIAHWLSVGLGSLIEVIERTLDRAFGLAPADRIQLDTTPLLRVDFAGRIDGLTKAVQGGLLTPNEARLKEGFGKLAGGDDGYLQRQMTPISRINELTAAELANAVAAKAPAAPAQEEAEDAEDPEDSEDPKPAKDIDAEVAKALVVSLFDRKRKAA